MKYNQKAKRTAGIEVQVATMLTNRYNNNITRQLAKWAATQVTTKLTENE